MLYTAFYAYLPQDRLRRLARGASLPDRTSGAALFADISGFTALTEKLNRELGPRHGAEEVTHQINAIFNMLIAQVDRYEGSVINFAGDAMTCWFDGKEKNNASLRAADCAFALQAAMRAFPELGLKVSVASGPARRMVVGDETIQLFDTLGGATLTRMAAGEHLAGKGETLVDESTTQAAGLRVAEWRTDPATGWRFGLAANTPASTVSVMALTLPAVSPEKLRIWVHPLLRKRETEMLNGFRVVTSLFLRFSGIDYDADNAPAELNTYMRWVQSVTVRYEGFLRVPIIGDKGSYLLIVFGAPATHEDDTLRAVQTALALQTPPPDCAFITSTQIGLTKGLVWAGLCGGNSRHNYDLIGDDVNLAARLMLAAAPGEILISERVQASVAERFLTQDHPPINLKGRAEPIPTFRLLRAQSKHTSGLIEPRYALPMVGRVRELQLINEKLDLAATGKGQVIGIAGEAGIGKSRLVAEMMQSARLKGFLEYGGACRSDGLGTPYLAWKSIWRAFFDVDTNTPPHTQLQSITSAIENRAPARRDTLPLLSAVLDLHLPENDFTQNLEPKIRQSALYALLEDCLKTAAQNAPILILIENLHWMDAVSYDLLEQLARGLTNYAVCFVIVYRPQELARLQVSQLESLPQFTRIELHELNPDEAKSAIRVKLAQLYPEQAGVLPAGLTKALMERTQGNPFYLEELLNYLHDQRVDFAQLHEIELPDSLHALIFSRIDQLNEQEKNILRAASIIGRSFRAQWLTGYYPELGNFSEVQAALDHLAALDITPLDTPEPELMYLFKHSVMHEVTYESIPFSTRAKLHERLAAYLEKTETSLLDVIAFHYERSENRVKQREYFHKAGKAAQKKFTNDAALNYYGKLLPLLGDAQEQIDIHLSCGEALHVMAKYDEAESHYQAALKLARDGNAPDLKARAQFALGRLKRSRGDYLPALEWLAQAQETYTALSNYSGMAEVLVETGSVLWRQGEYPQAREYLNYGLAVARERSNRAGMALAFYNLGNVSFEQGRYAEARTLGEECLAFYREAGQQEGIALALNLLGDVTLRQGDYNTAQKLHQESLEVCQKIGDKHRIAFSFNGLGNVLLAQDNYPAARKLYEESITLGKEIGAKRLLAFASSNLGFLILAQNELHAARALFEECQSLCQELGNKYIMTYAWLGLGLVSLREKGNVDTARQQIAQCLRLRRDLGVQLEQTSGLVGAAQLALLANDPQRAARLLGTIEATLKRLAGVLEPEMKYFYAQTFAAAKSALGEEAFRAAWATGEQMTLETAVQSVLQN
jgi:predicted ATPase/class 3 adenylate cyclase